MVFWLSEDHTLRKAMYTGSGSRCTVSKVTLGVF